MKSTNKNKHLRVWLSLLLLMVTVGMAAQNNRSWRNKLREESPEFHAITALWTFDGKWDPEKTVRELWPIIGY